MIFELSRCGGAAGDDSGEARAELIFEVSRCAPFEVSATGVSRELGASSAGDDSGEARAELRKATRAQAN